MGEVLLREVMSAWCAIVVEVDAEASEADMATSAVWWSAVS